MYARFSDSTDSPGPDNQQQSAGVVNFGSEQRDQLPKPPRSSVTVPANTSTTSAPSSLTNFAGYTGHAIKLTIVFAVVLVIVLCFTVANLVLVMQTRSSVYFDKRVASSIFGMSKTTTAKMRGYCDVLYLEKCFFAIQHGPMEYIDAVKACGAKEAFPANIYTKTHFMMIGAYLKRIRMGNRNFVWLGMTTNQKTGKSFFRDRSEITYDMPWFAAGGYPMNKTDFEQIAFHFAFEMKYDGFINQKPTYRNVHGALCELTDD